MNRRTWLRAGFVLCLLFSIVGCDSSSDDDDSPTVDGAWQGTVTLQGVALTVAMTLTEQDGQVSGVGTIDNITFSANGNHSFPNLSLTITSSGLADSSYLGTVSEDGRTITGTWTDPDLGGIQLTLRK